MDPLMREYEFAGFRLSVLRRQLRNPDGALLELPARAFDALVFLVEHRHEEIRKEQIIKSVWPDTIVEENNLNQAIFSLRRALGDSAGDPRFILTLPGRGYRFVADVTAVHADPVARRPARFRLLAIGVAVLAAAAAAGLGILARLRSHTHRPPSPYCRSRRCCRTRAIRLSSSA